MPVLSGGEAVLYALERHDVHLVFGIPGSHTLPIYHRLAHSRIRHITPRHEQGGGYAADGYARMSGRAGVCLLTTGPGLINAATAAATAFADSVPQLLISSALPTGVEGLDSGFLHESKAQRRALDALVATSHYPRSAAEIVEAIDEAFSYFKRGRPRPVHIGIPVDVLDSVGEVSPLAAVSPSVPPPDPELVRRAAALLNDADSIAMVLGGGARGAQREASALAERLGAPVVTTVNGKGVIDENHPLSLGASMRLRACRDWLCGRDAVLAVGTELAESDLWGPPLELQGELVRVDIDPDQLHKNSPADIGIAGDARDVLATLLEAIPDRVRAHNHSGDLRTAIDCEALEQGRPWLELCRTLSRALANNGVICADTAMASYFGAVHFLRLSSPSRFFFPTGYATLGYALPAAIGAKLARPDCPVIALVGDGGLMFTVAELATAAQLELSLPVVVVTNGGYGGIKDEMLREGIDPVGTDLREPDFPALAESMGCRGLRIDSADRLESALLTALRHPGPTLIEVMCPGRPAPPTERRYAAQLASHEETAQDSREEA